MIEGGRDRDGIGGDPSGYRRRRVGESIPSNPKDTDEAYQHLVKFSRGLERLGAVANAAYRLQSSIAKRPYLDNRPRSPRDSGRLALPKGTAKERIVRRPAPASSYRGGLGWVRPQEKLPATYQDVELPLDGTSDAGVSGDAQIIAIRSGLPSTPGPEDLGTSAFSPISPEDIR